MCISMPETPKPLPPPVAPPPPTPVAQTVKTPAKKARKKQNKTGNPLVIQRVTSGTNTSGMQSGVGIY